MRGSQQWSTAIEPHKANNKWKTDFISYLMHLRTVPVDAVLQYLERDQDMEIITICTNNK